MSGLDLAGLEAIELFYCLGMLGVAGVAHGMFGFGFAMIATPLLALILDYRLAIIAAALPLFFMATLFLALNWQSLQKENLIRLVVPGVIAGSLIGASFQAFMPQHMALTLLAALLIFSALLPHIVARLSWNAKPGNRPASAICSTFAGATEAALNVGAPFMLIYGAITRLNRIQQLLVLNLCFSVGKAIQIGVIAQASTTLFSLPLLSLAVLTALGGQFVGNYYAGLFSEDVYRKILKIFLYLMAMVLLGRAIWMK